jgi:hypothetical protein
MFKDVKLDALERHVLIVLVLPPPILEQHAVQILIVRVLVFKPGRAKRWRNNNCLSIKPMIIWVRVSRPDPPFAFPCGIEMYQWG